MTPSNKKQAMLPKGAECLINPVGTAPGFLIKIIDKGDHNQGAGKDQIKKRGERQRILIHKNHKKHGCQQLDKRVTPGDGRLTIATFTSKKHKTQDRHIFPGANGVIALRTMGTREDN